MSKEDIKKALEEMSKEELINLIAGMKDETPKKKRRRGKGSRKRNRAKTESFEIKTKEDKPRSGPIDTSGNRPNKFEDFMESVSLSESEKSELALAKESDSKNRNSQKTARSRKFSKIEVTCRICNKKESVSPSIVHDVSRYVCNNCCVRK
tara:strand:- start:645 stop:1097 length:453 start_codon:yes stop_codon:yes gene_type:complete